MKLTDQQIHARAIKNLCAVVSEIVDFRGRASWEITALAGEGAPQLAIREFKIGPNGWRSLSGHAGSGPDLASLIEHLAPCSRAVAIEHLARLVDRVERAAA